MSTIKVDSIQATGETASRGVSGVAAAWVNFNGTGTVAIQDSQNVASILDTGTGAYTASFTSNMSNTTYSVATGFARVSAPDFVHCGAPLTVSQGFEFWSNGSKADCSRIMATFHGDLA